MTRLTTFGLLHNVPQPIPLHARIQQDAVQEFFCMVIEGTWSATDIGRCIRQLILILSVWLGSLLHPFINRALTSVDNRSFRNAHRGRHGPLEGVQGHRSWGQANAETLWVLRRPPENILDAHLDTNPLGHATCHLTSFPRT